ncbi:heterokaryon incompatibility protein-domain-containing protein [Pyrenochaeta sp. MPI-SDFR-AT-0127]|nr:heterokaryon incompatibility protein-domain-containing protein [Pyrenochaeta sp. MPI-SDFR-AT-0127]
MTYELRPRHMILAPQQQLEDRKYQPPRPRRPAPPQLPRHEHLSHLLPPPPPPLLHSLLPPPLVSPPPLHWAMWTNDDSRIEAFAVLRKSPMQDRYQKHLQERVASEPEASVHLNQICSNCSIMGVRKGFYRPKRRDGSPGTASVALHLRLDPLFIAASQGCHHCTLISYSLKQREQERQQLLRRILKLSDELQIASESRRSEIQNQLDILTMNWKWASPPQRPKFLDSQLSLRVWHGGLGPPRFEIVESATHDTDQQLGEHSLLQGFLSYRRGFGNDITRDPNSVEGKARFSLWTGSQATFALARDWISTCKHHHRKCSVFKAQASSLPARILDITPSKDSTSIQLRYVSDIIRNDPTVTFQYVTLSHRWSRYPQFRLTKQSLHQLHTGVDDNVLSLTFQHAITAARKMNYRYIWIDSLCIIQDCKEDWQQESAIMGDIYRGSDCTLGALVDSNVQDGLFRARNPLASFEFPISVNFCLSSHEPEMKERLPEGILQSRGWVLQERALSPRTLYFGEEQIMWECCEVSANEGCPFRPAAGCPAVNNYVDPKKEFFQLTLQSKPKLSKPQKQLVDFQAAWSQILHIYTNSDLTFSTDRLVAINGIIRKIEQDTMLQAIAGLWKQILPAELLWFTSLSERKPQRLPRSHDATSYHAPSWSWASTDLPIFNDYASFIMRPHDKVYLKWYLRVDTVTVDARPNGQVHCGSLTIRAPVKKIDLSALVDYKPCRDFAVDPKEGSGLFRSYDSTQVRKYWTPDFAGVEGDDVYAVLVAQRKKYRSQVNGPKSHGIFHDGRCNMCIVVKKVGRGETFQRVGHLEEHHWKLDKWPTFTIFGRKIRTRITII